MVALPHQQSSKEQVLTGCREVLPRFNGHITMAYETVRGCVMARTRKYKRYSAEFKREVLKRASEDGVTDKEICEELGVSPRQLGRWRDELRLLG